MVLRPLRAAASAKSIVYVGRPQGAAAYFERLGHPCRAGLNIADMILDLVANEGKDGFGEVLGTVNPI